MGDLSRQDPATVGAHHGAAVLQHPDDIFFAHHKIDAVGIEIVLQQQIKGGVKGVFAPFLRQFCHRQPFHLRMVGAAGNQGPGKSGILEVALFQRIDLLHGLPDLLTGVFVPQQF